MKSRQLSAETGELAYGYFALFAASLSAAARAGRGRHQDEEPSAAAETGEYVPRNDDH
jgi:hypothetical protein